MKKTFKFKLLPNNLDFFTTCNMSAFINLSFCSHTVQNQTGKDNFVWRSSFSTLCVSVFWDRYVWTGSINHWPIGSCSELNLTFVSRKRGLTFLRSQTLQEHRIEQRNQKKGWRLAHCNNVTHYIITTKCNRLDIFKQVGMETEPPLPINL